MAVFDALESGKSVESSSLVPCKTSRCQIALPNASKTSKWRKFFRKYFHEGQKLSNQRDSLQHAALDAATAQCDGWDERLLRRYWKQVGFIIPPLFFHCAWWLLAFRYNFFALYPRRWQMPITMILGATVAGMTSEGGGAVAFPVMTLLLHIESKVARDFSLMIQSCGMTSAAFTIIWMKIALEWRTIVLGSVGAAVGCVFGLEVIDSYLPDAYRKMLFVSIWFSFGMALFLLNTQKKRPTFDRIPSVCPWKVAVLLVTGFAGGICTSFAGSGVDICSFSILTLLFRISEKVATPTSVVLMAVNTCVGFFWRSLITANIDELTWEYWKVSVPVVVVCAPLGSFLASHFHRLTLAAFVYAIELAAIIGFLLTRPHFTLIAIGCGIICSAFVFFYVISTVGSQVQRSVAVSTVLPKRCTEDESPTTF